MEQGVHEGCFTLDDIHVTAMAILAMLTGLNNWFKQSGRLSADIITDYYVSLILSSIHARANLAPAETRPSTPTLPIY